VRPSDEIDGNDENQPDEAPETPTDEPQPVPVQDPPAEPGRSPYVVAAPELDGLSEARV
jgi:hypothetical protein